MYSILLEDNNKGEIIDIIAAISEEEKHELQQASGDYKKAIKRAIKSWVALRFYSLEEIKGVFEKNEVMAVVDMQNGVLFQADMLSKHVKDVLLNLFSNQNPRLSEFVEKWDLDLEQIRSKIDSLTAAQAFFLIEWCHLFWNNPKKDIEDFVSDILEDDSDDK